MEKVVAVRMMECPLCDKVHEVEERTRDAQMLIKGEWVEFKEVYLVCCNREEDNEFETGKMVNENLLNARNAYRKKKNLLTSGEIVAIREQYGLSQVDLANLLGWGEATVSRYESKAIQDEVYDNVLKSIRENPLVAYEYLEKNKEKLDFKYDAIKEKIIRGLNTFGKDYLNRKVLESDYIMYQEPSEFNGNKKLDIEKLENVINFFAKRISGLYKVRLMKLLWYTDALSYKMNNISMTGLVYCHNDMGALPEGHQNIMKLGNIIVKEEPFEYEHVKYHIVPNDEFDEAVFTDDELDILNRVTNKFKYYNAKSIANYMHKEKAYKETKKGELISFELAKDIGDF